MGHLLLSHIAQAKHEIHDSPHPKLESAPDSPVKFPNNLAKIAVKKQA
jgi:hypothetical protein